MRGALILILGMAVLGCHREHLKPTCGTGATVVDLSSSGCNGLGFKLSDGSLVMPTHSFCGFGDDPLANFDLVAGQEVVIGYESEKGSPCSGVSAAKITCITLVEPGEK